MSLHDQYRATCAQENYKKVAAFTEKELFQDLEFAVRQHIDKKLPETAEQVKLALKRLDWKRGK